MVLLMANVIPLTISFLSFSFDIWFPISICYVKAYFDIMAVVFVILLQIEICWFKYWVEFKWKSVKQINDSFVISSLVVVNFVISSYVSILGVIESAGIQPITIGISSPFDRYVNMNRSKGFFVWLVEKKVCTI